MVLTRLSGIQPTGWIPIFAGLTAWCSAQSLLAQAVGDPVNGQKLYEGKCGACHSVEANRVGPLHRGVVGRPPGTAPGYDYSPAVKKLRGVWTPARIDLWLQDPQKVAPGTKMYFQVTDAGQRRDIIAYLVSVSPARPKP